ncbi:hypothetical protein HB364_14815 [Pseudoflavitalea sp. X16]|uniref:protein-disulfide reductase DsbD family protein n=1 Tax=Paraflavitalea devenefica TaxID=2716334 RepID=UPI0014237B68|nr:protein-disulfide reductase DsbD family protein [Paraflavitalea devenefica]NII26360.1 hypothetical protein [Paraflavitalea devenefica]
METGQLQVKEQDIVSVSVDEILLTPVKKIVAIIHVTVKAGYHIQANKVTNASLIPVSLETTPDISFLIYKPLFPPYKIFRLEGSEEVLNVFDSAFIIRLPIKVMANVSAGRYYVQGRIRYQACNSKTCLFPRNVDFKIPVVVQKSG